MTRWSCPTCSTSSTRCGAAPTCAAGSSRSGGDRRGRDDRHRARPRLERPRAGAVRPHRRRRRRRPPLAHLLPDPRPAPGPLHQHHRQGDPGGVVSDHPRASGRAPARWSSSPRPRASSMLPQPIPAKLLLVTAGSGITPGDRDAAQPVLPVHAVRRRHRAAAPAMTRDSVIFGPELRSYAARGLLRLVEPTPTSTACSTSPTSTRSCPTWPSARRTPAAWPGCSMPRQAHFDERGLESRSSGSAPARRGGRGGTVTFSGGIGRRADGAPDPRRRRGRRRPDAQRLPDGHLHGLRAALKEGAVRDLRNGALTVARAGRDRPGRRTDPDLHQRGRRAVPRRPRWLRCSERGTSKEPRNPVRRTATATRRTDSMTAITKKPVNPTAHLTPEDIEQIGVELDAIRQDVLDERGERTRRTSAGSSPCSAASVLGRARCSSAPRCRRWVLGTVGLSVAKILENMEIGHNVMHGQWDWMRDPKIHSDHVGVGQRLHGRGLEARPQRDPPHLHEHRRQGTTTSATGSCASTRTSAGAGVPAPAAVELRQRLFLRVRHRGLRPRAGPQPAAAEGEAVGRVQGLDAPHARQDPPAGDQDYVVNPALAIPFGGTPTLAANFTANVVRNVWSHSVIMCGHFPEGVETFEKKAIPEKETRASGTCARCSGRRTSPARKAMHLMTGNLSHQIEHHLPRTCRATGTPRSRRAWRRSSTSTSLRYHAAPLPQQVYSAWHRVVRLCCPTAGWRPPTARTCPSSSLLWAMSTKGPGSASGPPRRACSSRRAVRRLPDGAWAAGAGIGC